MECPTVLIEICAGAATLLKQLSLPRTAPYVTNPALTSPTLRLRRFVNPVVHSGRDLAWNNARLLWAVRDDPLARGLFLDSLAASTALASRMLLVAV